jgi:hypothetical protein
MDSTALERRCTKCQVMTPHSDFYTCDTCWCKECRKNDEKRRREDPYIAARLRHQYETDTKKRAAVIACRVRKRAKTQGVKCTLTAEWVRERLDRGVCEFSGLPFDLKKSSRDPRNPYGPAVDRKIAGGDYSPENCRLVLIAVNTALLDWGDEPFLRIVRAVVDRGMA